MKVIKTAAISSLIALCVIAAISLGQFAQAVTSLSEVRHHNLSVWAGMNKERLQRVETFKALCLSEGANPYKNPAEIKHPVGIDNCASFNGYGDSAAVIDAADATLQSFAWPLSMVDGLSRRSK